MKSFITFITSFCNLAFLGPQYSPSHFVPPRHLKLNRHTDIKFKRQKDGYFRRVTYQSGLSQFFFFFATGKNIYGNLTNFCHVYEEAETDWRQKGQQVTRFLDYGLCTIYVPFSGQWRWSLRDRLMTKKKKNYNL